jgi:hypothetical protein
MYLPNMLVRMRDEEPKMSVTDSPRQGPAMGWGVGL